MNNQINKGGAAMNRNINLALIASGSGTDANSIMQAWKSDCIPEINSILLISTNAKAGCLDKADKLSIPTETVDYSESTHRQKTKEEKDIVFGKKITLVLKKNKINLIFLVGCIKIIPTIRGIPMYNIHPADPKEHGGHMMYGLDVHVHVLKQIQDRVSRGWNKPDARFFTYPTIHEASPEYDQGQILLQGYVEIPRTIIIEQLNKTKTISIHDLAKRLQEYVLPYEWLMLPAAVRMAAKKIPT